MSIVNYSLKHKGVRLLDAVRALLLVVQRKDGAIAVSKLHAKKPERKKTEHMHKVKLKTKRHSALSKDS